MQADYSIEQGRIIPFFETHTQCLLSAAGRTGAVPYGGTHHGSALPPQGRGIPADSVIEAAAGAELVALADAAACGDLDQRQRPDRCQRPRRYRPALRRRRHQGRRGNPGRYRRRRQWGKGRGDQRSPMAVPGELDRQRRAAPPRARRCSDREPREGWRGALARDSGSPFPESVQVTSLPAATSPPSASAATGRSTTPPAPRSARRSTPSGAVTSTAPRPPPRQQRLHRGRPHVRRRALGAQLFDAAGAKIGLDHSPRHAGVQPRDRCHRRARRRRPAMTWHATATDLRARPGRQRHPDRPPDRGRRDSTGASQPSIAGRPDEQFRHRLDQGVEPRHGRSLVFAQIYDAAGVPDGAAFLVSAADRPSPTPESRQCSLVMLASGDLVVAWHGAGPGDERSPGSIYPSIDGGIRLQIFGEVADASARHRRLRPTASTRSRIENPACCC